MNHHPPAVVAKAQRLAELLERVEQGEPREQIGHELQQRHRQRWHKLFHQLGQHCQQAYPLRQRLLDQEAERNAIDTNTLCRERQLEKDQIMLNWQVMLTHLHDWTCHHFFAPTWQNLELETATRLIYRKAGRVHGLRIGLR